MKTDLKLCQRDGDGENPLKKKCEETRHVRL